jgi:translation initiation factor IF-2
VSDRYVIVERRDGHKPRVLIEADTLEEAEALLESLRRLHHHVDLLDTGDQSWRMGRPNR